MDGYFSVRRKPRQSAVDLVSRLYAQMLDAENKAGSRDACTASINMLTDLLNEKGMSYEAFILLI